MPTTEFKLLVTKFKKNKPRQSGLYNLLHLKLQSTAALVSNAPQAATTLSLAEQLKILDIEHKEQIDRIIFKENIHAYLIALKSRADLYNLTEDQDYTLHDRHIRIDRDYGMPDSTLAEKLFLNWHYTERWKKKGEYVEIHAYYHHGIFQSLWIKKVINNKPGENIQENLIDRINNFKKNATDAHKIVLDLLEQVIKHKEKVQNEFESLMDELAIEKFPTLNNEQFNAKILECEEKHAELSSFLEDYYDPRFEMLIKNIDHALKTKNIKTTGAEEEEEEFIAAEVPNANISVAVTNLTPQPLTQTTQPSLAYQIKNLKKHINKAISEFDSIKLINLQQKRENLETEIVTAHFNAQTPELMQEIHNQHVKLQELPSLESCLKQFAMGGKVEAFKTLLPAIVNQLPFNFFEDYILHIASKCENNQQQAHIAICNELFKSSSVYRMFISLTKRCCIGYINTAGDMKIHFSPYFSLAWENNFDLFCALIKQCGDPDIDGLIVKDSAYSLLSSMIDLGNDHKYVQFLLDQGAMVEGIRGTQHRIAFKPSQSQGSSVFFSRNVPQRLIAQRNINMARNNPYYATDRVYFHSIEFNSSLVILSQDKKYSISLLEQIASQSSTENIALALALLSVQKGIGSMTCFADHNHLIAFAQTPEERCNIAQERAYTTMAPKKHVSLVFGAEEPAANIFLNKLINFANARLSNLSSQAIEQLALNLYKFGIEQSIKGLHGSALIAFKAILIVECFNNCGLDSHKRIIFALTKIASSYRNDQTGWLEPQSAQRQAIANFINAKNFANFSIFKDELIKTETYKEACKPDNQNLQVIASHSNKFSIGFTKKFNGN